MVLEKVPLIFEGRGDRLGLIDVPLATVNDGNVSQSKRDNSAGENVDDVRSLVPVARCQKGSRFGLRNSHQIDLGQNTDRSRPIRINISCQLQTI